MAPEACAIQLSPWTRCSMKISRKPPPYRPIEAQQRQKEMALRQRFAALEDAYVSRLTEEPLFTAVLLPCSHVLNLSEVAQMRLKCPEPRCTRCNQPIGHDAPLPADHRRRQGAHAFAAAFPG